MIKGVGELQDALRKFNLNTEKVLDKAVRITAFDVLNNATKSIKTVSKGRQVPRGDNYHTVSKEGDAPNTDTGRLIDSIDVVHDKGSMVAEVGTNLPYGAMLETTYNRPWLNPAKDKSMANFSKAITRVVDLEIKRAG